MPKDDKTTEKAWSPEIQQLQDLYEVMLEKGLDILELKDDDLHVRLVRNLPASGAGAPHGSGRSRAHPRPAATAAQAEPPAHAIRSPLAGVFYRASSPTTPPYIKEGDVADAGQTLCIVEAMKVMNEIKAEARCRIASILVENGRPVTAGQALFGTEPA